MWDRTEIPEIARDLIILAVAHNKAGDPIPFTVDYNPEDTFDYRGVRTNSVFQCLHLQRYLFSGGTTQEVEAHTVSGTLEVTARASIRSQDDNLTRSFWYQIEGFARDSLRARLHKHDLDKVYKWIMDVFFRVGEVLTWIISITTEVKDE